MQFTAYFQNLQHIYNDQKNILLLCLGLPGAPKSLNLHLVVVP